jgi:hypothetical protein
MRVCETWECKSKKVMKIFMKIIGPEYALRRTRCYQTGPSTASGSWKAFNLIHSSRDHKTITAPANLEKLFISAFYLHKL